MSATPTPWKMLRALRWHPTITVRARTVPASPLLVLPADGAEQVTHWLGFPRGACPVSGNPIVGLVRVRYEPALSVLEVVSLQVLIQSLALRGAQSIEGAAGRLHEAVTKALQGPAQIDLWLLVRPGPQVVHVRRG